METCKQTMPLHLAAGWASVTLSRDYGRSCLTASPFPHSHPMYEVHYVLRGSCILETAQGSFPCPRGEFLLLPPRITHRLLPREEPAETLSFLLEPKESRPELGKLPRHIPDRFEGAARLLRIREELLQRRPAYEEKIQGELIALLADLTRALGRGGEAPEAGENRAEEIEAFLVENRFRESCTCQALADAMHLSVRQVQRLCQEYYGLSFRQLVETMRMETAAHLLRTTTDPVGEVGLSLGYGSAAAFSAAYRRWFGWSPSKERTFVHRTE